MPYYSIEDADFSDRDEFGMTPETWEEQSEMMREALEDIDEHDD